jgi:hypothetical protein
MSVYRVVLFLVFASFGARHLHLAQYFTLGVEASLVGR